MTESIPPTFTLVVEWENLRFSALEHTRQMLRQLNRQITALVPVPPRSEVFFLYDPDFADWATVERVVAEELRPDQLPSETRLIAVSGLRYYEQRNHAAALAIGDIVVFLDCDVIPEDGWLAAMLEPFARPDVRMVGGHTYLDHHGLYGKACAVCWFFRMRDAAEDLRPTDFYHANNVAFRREFFLRNPFPDMLSCRGQGRVHAHRLRQKGVGLLMQMKARVRHPPPNGVWHFVLRALHSGRDEVFVKAALDPSKHHRKLRAVFDELRFNLDRTVRDLRRYYGDAVLGPFAAVAILIFGLSYYLLKTVGGVITVFRPGLLPRLLPIEARPSHAPTNEERLPEAAEASSLTAVRT